MKFEIDICICGSDIPIKSTLDIPTEELSHNIDVDPHIDKLEDLIEPDEIMKDLEDELLSAWVTVTKILEP